ncbi:MULTISPECIES: LTA synthase family protein [Paenibacillus]|uniref:LTA synthase family protein n=1 Tax=Paenibacillus TaxID=44249 RepID=UPI00096C3E49|nr:LTA synthase family protein [Paenibacillus odorifer]MEC0135111.1 LTA synthase family protein [Paenibacillus odorifer]MEC0223313.1 LTA synthase family protein [Paenibacillus odorifer]OMD04838.1 sulfatase [Paenibacillus odorifer]OMD14118.1 sulfatase [Paenibacillus odorifer]OME52430.1 sulfatase [Paenibacillus odorifer]
MKKHGPNRAQFYIVVLLLWLKLLLLRVLFFDRIAWEWIAADVAPVLFIMGILTVITPSRVRTAVYWTFNGILSLLLFAASVYFNHFGSVPTYLALYELNQVFQVKASVESTIQTIDYLFFADLVIMVIYVLIRRWKHGKAYPHERERFSSRNTRLAHMMVILVAILGGFAFSANSVNSARGITNELVQAESAGFLNYEVVAAIKVKEDNNLIGTGDIKDTIAKIDELQASYPYSSKAAGTAPEYFGSQKGKNVIVIQMEAFQNFPLHQSLKGQELTPVLNKLADEGFYFPHVYQQIGPGNTSDAEFMSNTSIYPIGTLAMSTGFGDRELPSLPRLLRDKGYEAYTFHVNQVGFWNRNELYPALGFNGYYDKDYFTNDHFNAFGASDEQLYITGVEKMAELQKKGTPFYAQMVTASSHHPFQIPDSFKKISVPDELKNTMLGDYLTAINYTDYAIGTLIEGLKKNGMWDNTVLVMYGDHFGLQPQDVPPEQVESALGIPYDSRISRFNIPLIVHVPGMEQGKVVERTGGQLDILPTIANLLGVSLREEGYTAFGHDLLNIDRNVLGMRYYLPSGSFFNDDILYVPGKDFADGEAVSLDTLKPVSDFTKYQTDYDYILKLMNLSDEYVKLLPQR